MAIPWLTFSEKTLTAQRKINIFAIAAGKCPPLVEDGKLGPSTCGAAKAYAGLDPDISSLVSSCKSFNDAAANACNKLPWNVAKAETVTVQFVFNKALELEGFCPIEQDGKLGPKTCAAAKKVIGAQEASRMGCSSYGTLQVCEVPTTAQETAPVKQTSPAQEQVVTAEEPQTIALEPQMPAQEVTQINRPTEIQVDLSEEDEAAWDPITESWTITAAAPPPVIDRPAEEDETNWGTWAIIGGLALAAGAGTFMLLRKKKGR